MNDIVESIRSTVSLFADDTSLYTVFDDPKHAANQLNSDFDTIHQSGHRSDWL